MASPFVISYSSLDTYMRATIPMVTLGTENLVPSDELRYFFPQWTLLRDCYAGELQIKSKGQTYLRKLSAHDDEAYKTYLARAYWYNAVQRTHQGLLGSVFRERPTFTLPDQLSARLDLHHLTIDNLSARELAQRLVAELLLVGRHGMLVDIPEDAGPAPVPYVATYAAEAIYGYRTALIRGRRVVDRIVLIEQKVQNTEYSTKITPLYRVLRLDDTADGLVYSQEIHDSEANTIRLVAPRPNGRVLNYIPFVFVNPRDLLPQMSASPLLHIATLNLSHYDSTALLEHGRFYAGMPTYYIAGEGMDNLLTPGQEQQWVVGPSNVWQLGVGDKAGLLEFNGHGLSFLENACDSKQLQMQSLGGRMIPSQQKAAALSTEAYALMEQGDEATLMDVVLTAERALTHVFEYAADLANITVPKDSINIQLNKQFVRSDLTAREVRAIQTLYERRLIPLDVLYHTLSQVGVIPQDYDLETFRKLLQSPSQQYLDADNQPIPGGKIHDPLQEALDQAKQQLAAAQALKERQAAQGNAAAQP